MLRRRRCRVCGRWFYPHPRAGGRQHVCSDKACQAERHRRNCSTWHQGNPGYDRERRLLQKLQAKAPPEEGVAGVLGVDPLAKIDWDVARDAVGLEPAVIIEEIGKVLVGYTRDAVHSKPLAITGKSPEVPVPAARDDIGPAGPSP
jgi:hypothetical protein